MIEFISFIVSIIAMGWRFILDYLTSLIDLISVLLAMIGLAPVIYGLVPGIIGASVLAVLFIGVFKLVFAIGGNQ